MLHVKLSQKAKNDLIEIWEYTFEKWSSEQADRYFKLLNDEFTAISKNPEVGRNYDFARSKYRGARVKSHIIFYKVSSPTNVEIIRILHSRMDLAKMLDE